MFEFLVIAILISVLFAIRHLLKKTGTLEQLELKEFQLHVPVSVLVFKATPGEETWLYYGNPKVSAPRYDITLAANELLLSPKSEAQLGMEQALRAEPWCRCLAATARDQEIAACRTGLGGWRMS